MASEGTLVRCKLRHLWPPKAALFEFDDLLPDDFVSGLEVRGSITVEVNEKDVKALLVKLPNEVKWTQFRVLESDAFVLNELDACEEETVLSNEWGPEMEEEEEEEPGPSGDAVFVGPGGLKWVEVEIEKGKRAKFTPRLQHVNHILYKPVEHFLHFLPRDYITSTLLPATNAACREAKPGWMDVTEDEFLLWLGMWLYISTFNFRRRRDFWDSSPPSLSSPLPRLNHLMSLNRFEAILVNLRVCLLPRPEGDRFFEVRHMVAAFNEHVNNVFSCGTQVCLDESMVAWTRRATCPGWIFMPAKPTKFGNEYRTACDVETGIMCFAEIVMGRHAPKGPGAFVPEFAEHGATPGLLLRAAKMMNIAHTWRHLFVDSGYCSPYSAALLQESGVHYTASMKRLCKFVPHTHIEESAASWTRYTCLATSVKVPCRNQEHDIDVFVMKDESYNTQLISTHGSTAKSTEEYLRLRKVADDGAILEKSVMHKFYAPHVLAAYYGARHAVDDHNHLRQGVHDLEVAMRNSDWITRQFSFLISTVAVNAYLSYRHFSTIPRKQQLSAPEFRGELALELISRHQRAVRRGGADEARQGPAHELVNGFQKKNKNGVMVRHVLRCALCSALTSSRCICTPDRGVCKKCIVQHASLNLPLPPRHSPKRPKSA